MTETIEQIRVKQAAWCEAYQCAPWWLQLLGATRAVRRRDTVRTIWGEITFGKWQWAFDLGAHETAHLHVAFPGVQAFIRLPWLDSWFAKRMANSVEGPRYGFTVFDGSLHLHFGRRYKIFDPIWQKRYLQGEFLTHDGRWLSNEQRERSWKPGEGVKPYTEQHPYYYMLVSGEVQHVTATVHRERRTICWRWFSDHGPVSRYLRRLSPWRTVDYIEVEFSDEVGERAGSWKGGCVGCAYDMRPGETPLHTLMRMQRERRFG